MAKGNGNDQLKQQRPQQQTTAMAMPKGETAMEGGNGKRQLSTAITKAKSQRLSPAGMNGREGRTGTGGGTPLNTPLAE